LNPSTREIWNQHYKKEKSKLSFPDENLVRILSKLPNQNQTKKALDFGAGSGRHSFLLKSFGYEVTALDYSKNSLEIIQDIDPEIQTVYAETYPYLFVNESFDLIVSWGVLHYNSIEDIQAIVQEYHRILKKNGYLTGTIRANTDTHLKVQDGKIGLEDLKNARVKLFSLEELKFILRDFIDLKIGYIERTPIGNLEERICHWIFLAQK
jgi:SAM-dependent methyltransferase